MTLGKQKFSNFSKSQIQEKMKIEPLASISRPENHPNLPILPNNNSTNVKQSRVRSYCSQRINSSNSIISEDSISSESKSSNYDLQKNN